MSHLSRTFSRDLREYALKSGEGRRDLLHFVMIAERQEEEIALLHAGIEVLKAKIPQEPSSEPVPLVAFYTDSP